MCDGQGRTPTHEKLDIEVPAGIASGRQLRVSGYGEAGFRGAASGDLIVSVQVAEHERFARNQDDLYCDVPVSIAQAALGCTVEIDGILEGEKVKVTVPAGTQHGGMVAVDGHGMPRSGASSRGRLIARIVVTVPEKLSAEARELLEKYAEVMGEDVDNAHKSVGERIRDAIDDILD